MNKIRTIIVDDGKLVIEDLLNLVDWDENGFEIVGTAYDGKEGLELYNRTTPDLIITDLKMPVLSGVELAREIRRKSKTAKIIFLSGYEDFYAARLAISLEVNDYILKHEMDRETLLAKLDEIKQEIMNDQLQDRREFEKAIFEYFSENETQRAKLEKNMIERFRQRYCMMLVTLKQPLPIMRLLSNISIKFEEKFDANAVFKNLKSHDATICGIVEQLNDKIIFILDFNSTNLLGQKINLFAGKLATEMEKYFGKEFTINILSQDADIFECRKLFLQYDTQIQVNYFFQKSQINYLSLNMYHYDNDVKFDIGHIKNCIKTYDSEDLCQYIDKVYTLIFKNYAYGTLSTITGHLLVLLEDYRYKVNSVRGEPLELFKQEDACRWTSVEGIADWLKEKFVELILCLRHSENREYSDTVNMAIQFICKHYDDPELCLEHIEKHVGISYSRLCIIFKQETGVSINNFIIDYRMKKAKELLSADVYKISEIAQSVGFSSTSYFCKVFKKATGFSPLGYKGRLKKDE